jgi:hypothetical protein
MDEHGYRHKTKTLWVLIVIAAGYSLWFDRRHMLTGNHLVDSAISVLLGLFICSRPAGNAIDLLFYERAGLRRIMSRWSGVGWLALNVLTLLAGWVVIYVGTTHLMSRGD